jgi:hypothetical protein
VFHFLTGGTGRDNGEPALMHHALPFKELDNEEGRGFTAEFNEPTEKDKLVKVLLDHILVATLILDGDAPLHLVKNSGRIEHEAYKAELAGREAHERPSDHRPVSARFTIR